MRTVLDNVSSLNTTITVYDKKYKLQHPGTREWIKLKKEMREISSKDNKMSLEIDTEKVVDYFFEHCCFPELGEKLSIDTILPQDFEEVWEPVSLMFLRGELGKEYCYPEKK
jgi:hypothetical protein